jgi:hypothetical protein
MARLLGCDNMDTPGLYEWAAAAVAFREREVQHEVSFLELLAKDSRIAKDWMINIGHCEYNS